MSQMITNADGSQSEVFTVQELEEAKKSATDIATKAATDSATKLADERVEEYKKQNPPAAEALESLKDDVAEKETKITELEQAAKSTGDGESGNEQQIKRLREERDEMKTELEKKIDDMGKAISVVTGDTKTELVNNAVKNALQSDIEAAGGKDEFKKKVELKYDSFEGDILTRVDIESRVGDAVTLVTGNKPSPGMLDNATGGASKGEGDQMANLPKQANEVTKKVGAGLGITDEDRKKYGPGGDKHRSSSSVN